MRKALVLILVLGGTLAARAGTAPFELEIHTAFVADNHVVFDGEGRLHLVYYDLVYNEVVGNHTDVFHTMSDDEGLTWATPVNLTSSVGEFSYEPPDVAVDPAGNVVAVWSEGGPDSAAVYVWCEAWGWDTPQKIAETGNWATGPKIEFDSQGVAHILWYDQGDPDSRLAYLRLEGGGPWPVTYIGPAAGYAQYPSLAVDAEDNLHAVFSHGETYPDEMMDVFYLTSTDGGNTWSDTSGVCNTPGEGSLYPHLLVDSFDGTLHVVWQEGGRGSAAEVHYSSSDGSGWSEPENLSNTTGASLHPTLSQDALGTLYVVWSDAVDGDFDVYRRSGDWTSGALGWAPRVNLSRTGESSEGATQMERLDRYGQIVCWVEGDAKPYEFRCWSGFSDVRFEDAAAEAGFVSTGFSRGAAWADLDRDGLEDVVVLGWVGESRIHRNRGDQTFEILSDLGTSGAVNGAAWGDYDNDGDRDLAVAELGGALLLYENGGDGNLTEVGAAVGLPSSFDGWAVAWCDFDCDGWIDLFASNFGVGANALYHNDGGEAFSDWAAGAGVGAAGMDCRGAAWADYDGNGWPDLYVTAHGQNLFFRNAGDSTFTEVAAALGVADLANGEACCWADFDMDGDLDLFVLNGLEDNILYRNENDGTFTDVTDSVHLAARGRGSVAVWEDVDNDGDPDLFTSGAPTALFRNNGRGLFAEAASAAGLQVSTTAEFYGAGWADVDNDGDPDLILTDGSNGRPNALFFNGGYQGDFPEAVGGWIGLDLVGEESNRDAIGAGVTLISGGRTWHQETSGGLGLSQNAGTVRFGLGDRPDADTVVVRWPSGALDTLFHWRSNRRATVHEGQSFLDVWPGDTNNDGVVDEADVLPLVVYWHARGARRDVPSPSAWEEQGVRLWDPDSAAYADADGSGRVEVADLLPIGLNWGRTHVLAGGAKICRPRIRDHGPYLARYEALHRSVVGAPPGTGLEAVRVHLESLIAEARGSRVGSGDRLLGFDPNPCRRGTRVHLAIGRPGPVDVAVFDVTGRRVATLLARDLPAGAHEVFWDGSNAAGRAVAPGVYLCRMTRGRTVDMKKLVVVR